MKLSLLVVAAVANAISSPGAAQNANSLTVYSGRGKGLVDPIVQQFERDTGITVNVRYGTDAALLAALQEEGARSPADVFWTNTSGALGVAGRAGLLGALPAALRGKTPAFRPESGTWTPLSVRFRVMAYNTARVKPADLPASVMDVSKLASLKGRIGWTPTYSSFQDFVGAMIALKGEPATRAWLEAMKALEPKAYTSNPQMLEAIRSGEIDVALTNHYYVQRLVKSGAPLGTHYFAAGDPGSLALVTGAGILKSSAKAPLAQRLLSYLQDARAQQFFTGELFEYPAVPGSILPTTLLPFDDMVARSPKVDQERTGDTLQPALKLLREAGLL